MRCYVCRSRVGVRAVIPPEGRPLSRRLPNLVAAAQQLLDGAPPCFVAPESRFGAGALQLVSNIREVEHQADIPRDVAANDPGTGL